MPNLVKQILAVAGPVVLFVISLMIYLRYADGAGPEVFIAVAIGIAMFSAIAISLNSARISRRAAQRAGLELARTNPGFKLILGAFDRRALQALQKANTRLAERLTPGLSILRIEPEQISVFRTKDLVLLGSLVVGSDLEGFSATTINRGNAFNEPCLRLRLEGGGSTDVLVYEVTTGKWPSQASLGQLLEEA